MTTIHVDTEGASGSVAVIPDPDGSGFHIQLPDTTVEVSSAQLTSIVTGGQTALGVTSSNAKPAFFGDSNFLLRSGVTTAQAFPAVMAAAMGAASHGVFAVSGETSGQGLARIQAVIDFLPTHVFLDFGVNDADLAKSVTPAQYEANMRSIIGTLLGRGIKVVLMSPIMIAETGYLERQRDSYMPVWQKVARIHGVTSVDCWSRMAAITMHTNRAAFDALCVDVQHWGVAGNVWRRDLCKTALGI
jgi:hypothetical protein